MKEHTNKISARWVKDNISLVQLLSNLGYPPPKPVGKERMYISMLRDSDSSPSFSVDEKSGTWFDHGEGKGGNIIDFALQYWNGLSFPEVLEKIMNVSNAISPAGVSSYERKEKIKTAPNYGIRLIKELGNNIAITNYLKSRGLISVAEGRLKEIYYYIENENKLRTNYFAAGWLNEKGTWEVRNPSFKGSLGQKAISFIPNSGNRLAVFEGYFNYLSWLTENPFATESVLVLNSLSLVQKALEKATEFKETLLFFDRDYSGEKATALFKQALPHASDRSGIYEGFNDYNDKIVKADGGIQLSR